MRNMSSNGTLKNEVDSLSQFKKTWDNHSAKTRYVSTAIKIKDNNGNGSQPSYSKNRLAGLVFYGHTENREKTTQTDQFGFIDLVQKEIQKQMCNYSAETADQIIDQQLSLLLAKLERENRDLKRTALTFAVELEIKSNALKRNASNDQNVAAQITPTKIPTTSPSVSPQCYQSLRASSMVSSTLVNDNDGNEIVQQSGEVEPPYRHPPALPSSFTKPPQSVSLSKCQPFHLTPVHLDRSLVSKTDFMQESTRYSFGYQPEYNQERKVKQVKGIQIVSSNSVLKIASTHPILSTKEGSASLGGHTADKFTPQQYVAPPYSYQLKHQRHHQQQHQKQKQKKQRQQQKSRQHKLLKPQQRNQKQQKEQQPQQQQLQQQQQQQQHHQQKQQQQHKQKQQWQQPQEHERRRKQQHQQQQQQPQEKLQEEQHHQQEKQHQHKPQQEQQPMHTVQKSRNTLLKSVQCSVQNNFQTPHQTYLRQPMRQPPTLPPLPTLTTNISTSNNEVVLTWDFDAECMKYKEQYKVKFYQLFAYHTKDIHVSPPRDVKQWKKIGVVNALPLPMGCTLLQLENYSAFFFAVIAIDENKHEGCISKPCLLQSVDI